MKKTKKVAKKKRQSREAKRRAIIKELNSNINRGVKTLDRKFGRLEWISKIDLSMLRLNNADLCICGQLFGNFWSFQFGKFSASQMRVEHSEDGENTVWAERNGFWSSRGEYDALTYLWYVKIVELRAKAGVLI